MYIYDPQLQDAERINSLYLPSDTPEEERRICEELLIDPQNDLHQHSAYVRDFKQICQISDDDLHHASFVITEKARLSNAGLERIRHTTSLT